MESESERAAIARLLERVRARGLSPATTPWSTLSEPGGGNDGDNGGGGMKRGRADPAPRFVWPAHFPDELLCELLLAAYDWRLLTLLENEELHQTRQVSRRFARVIDACVVPQIRELGAGVLAQMSERFDYHEPLRLRDPPQQHHSPNARLLHFAGLESLLIDIPLVFSGASALDALHALPRVRRVDLRNYGHSVSSEVELLGAMRHVLHLSLYRIRSGMRASSAALRAITGLRSLVLDDSPFFADDCLLGMSALQTLVVRGDTEHRHDMSGLASLDTLVLQLYHAPRLDTLPHPHAVHRLWLSGPVFVAPGVSHDAILATLPGLTALAVNTNGTDLDDAALSRLTTLRSLLLPWDILTVTPDSISRLSNLQSLCLARELAADLTARHTAALPRLNWLSLRHSKPRADALGACNALVYLDLRHCNLSQPRGATKAMERAIGGMHNLQTLLLSGSSGFRGKRMPLSLMTLALDSCDGVGNAVVARLTNLTELSLAHNQRITDSGVMPLLALRRLDLTHNRLVSEYACSDMPALELLAARESLLYEEYESYVGGSHRFRFAFKAPRCVVTSRRVDLPNPQRAIPEWRDVRTLPLAEDDLYPELDFPDFIAPSAL